VLAALMVLMEWRRRAPATVAESAAERRKQQWSARRERFWMAAVYISTSVFILLITAQFIYARSLTALSPAATANVVSGNIVIPASQAADGQLHRYVAHLSGGDVRFLLYRKPDGDTVAVFDACQICGGIGFYQTSSGIVCKNCAAPVNPQAVGQPGGCNPIPLNATTNGGNIIISAQSLASGLHYFQH